jgi:hypothetical protein
VATPALPPLRLIEKLTINPRGPLANRPARVRIALGSCLSGSGRGGGSDSSRLQRNPADAQHIVTELTGRFLLERQPLRATVLNVNRSALTAIGNDYGNERVFARELAAHARPGDVLLAISTSGKQPQYRASNRGGSAKEC